MSVRELHGAPGPLVDGVRLDAGEVEIEGREVEIATARVHADHPEVSRTAIATLAVQAHAELRGARVQNYRLVLVERQVRRALATAVGSANPRQPT